MTRRPDRRFLLGAGAGVLATAVVAVTVALATGTDPAEPPDAGPDSSFAQSAPERSDAATPAPSRSEEPDDPQDDEDADGELDLTPGWERTAVAGSTDVPDAGAVSCPAATVQVGTADELSAALASSAPGSVIELADGTYEGEFVAETSGTPEQPIFLCGGSGAVLDGGDVEGGYVLHLDGAQHWRLVGFTVTNGQKGVMADGTVGSVIQGLTVTQIGDEAIHLRRHSADNVVRDNTIDTTGLRKERFGEGVYIGSAESNWCDVSDCAPDRSDRNVIVANTISGTTSESIDIKEGTTGGVVSDNDFDGSHLSGADSWVDVKGNAWLVEGNRGTSSPEDGFQTHEILEGWGDRNLFRANTAAVDGPGVGIAVQPELTNRVTCDNEATGAEGGLSNVECTSGA